MSKMSRTKGAKFERRVANALSEALGCVFKRRVRNHTGESDLTPETPEFAMFSLECKNQAVLKLPEWWRQTLEQTKEGQVPVLFYKKAGSPAMYVMFDAHDVNASAFPRPRQEEVTFSFDGGVQMMREIAAGYRS